MLFEVNGPGDLAFVTWRPDVPSPSAAGLAKAYSELAEALDRAGAVVLQERLFCELGAADSALEARDASPARRWPVPPTVVEGAPCEGSGTAGIQVVGARPRSGAAPEVVTCRDSACGMEIVGTEASYLTLSDVGRLVDSDLPRRPPDEARDTIHLAEDLLAEHRWSFRDVRRTWFFLRDILDWYDDFNRARNGEFDRMGLSLNGPGGDLPASTGIRGHNGRGDWCVLDLLAVRPRDGSSIDVRRLSNPHQNEAPEYGSAFSRGLALTTKSCRYVFVSGTASIDEAGRSVCGDDFESQTERTLDTVAALLEVGGGGWDDVCQSTVFVKRPGDVAALGAILDRRGVGRLPAVCALGDICRSELLFELDATAVVGRGAA